MLTYCLPPLLSIKLLIAIAMAPQRARPATIALSRFAVSLVWVRTRVDYLAVTTGGARAAATNLLCISRIRLSYLVSLGINSRKVSEVA